MPFRSMFIGYEHVVDRKGSEQRKQTPATFPQGQEQQD
jgi:hypothetical protein